MGKENGYLLIAKIGTDTLVRDGRVDTAYVADVANQIAQIRASGINTVLVSSGALAAGGQEHVTKAWQDAVAPHRIVVTETLFAEDTFAQGLQKARRALDRGQLPLINGDHARRLGEITTNNDLLAVNIATRLDAQAVILLTNVDGVLNPDGQVIPNLNGDEHIVFDGTSNNGTGGMEQKVRAARTVAAEGRTALIAHGRRRGVLVDFAAGRNGFGTRFARQ